MGKVRGSSPLGSTVKNKIIIFDFDGVIVNSCQLSFEIDKEFFVNLEYSELQDWAEGNIFKGKLRENHSTLIDELYLEKYSQRINTLLPMEGIENVFKELDLLEYKLIIVSSADENSIKDFLENYSLDKYFIEILGRKAHFNKSEKFKMIFDKYKIKAKETLIITDSVGDLKEAQEVKMKTIGVTWGLHEKERLEKNGASFIADEPKDIIKGIKEILVLN